MNQNIKILLDIKKALFINLCNIVNNNYYNYETITKDYLTSNNYELLIDYIIIKNNNKIYCINSLLDNKNINEFSKKQLSFMRIKYESFNISFPNNYNDITDEYIDKLKNEINNIIIIIKNYHKNNKEYIIQNMILPYNFKLYITDISNYNKYCVDNIKELLKKCDLSHGYINKANEMNNIYIFLYNNFDFIINNKKFRETVYNNLSKNNIDIDNIILSLFKSINIDYNIINKIIIYKLGLIRVGYMFKKIYSLEELDLMLNKEIKITN